MSLELLRQKVKEKCENNPHLDFKPVDKIPNTKLHNYIKGIVEGSLKKRYNLFIQELLDEKNTDHFRDNFLSSAYIDLFSTKTVIGKQLEQKFENCIRSGERITKNLIEGKDISDRSFDFFAVFAGYKGGQDFLNECLSNEYLASRNQGDKKDQAIIIPGATIIDKEFIMNIREDNNYTPEQFYTAMHNNNSQWYGVISDFVINRNAISKNPELGVEDILTSLFSESQQRIEKVSLVLCGTGGVGKTTLLRKWAINFCDESKFIVLWINSFEQFIKDGISKIEQKRGSNFLVIIHDWDHLVLEDPKTTVRKFLEQTLLIDNIRIIIGDRVPSGKVYEDYQADRNAVFELNSSENKKIIHEISKKCPQWKNTIDELSENSKSNDSSLYLTLFIIARLNDGGMKYTNNKPEDLFIRIIRSDLEIIAEKYIGLAKALYYWGCAYAKYKVSISYSTFLEIATYYQKDRDIKDKFESLNRDTITHRKLRGLISINDGLLKFHHDVLADVGINQVVLKELGEFDDDVKLDLLDVIIEMESNKASCNFLTSVIRYDEVLNSEQEQLKYFQRLISKGNQEEEYMVYFVYILLGERQNVLVDFARKILDNNIRSHVFWKFYLHNTKSDKFSILKPKLPFFLEDNQIVKQSPLFTYQLLNHFYNELPVQEFIYNILKNSNWASFNDYIIHSCLTFCKDKKMTQEFVKNILDKDEWKKNDDFRTVLKCLEHTSYEAKESFFKKVVTDSDYKVIEKFFEQCRKFSKKEISEQFIKIAINNKEGDHPDAIRNILFIEEVGLSGYL